jgi:hypothetical protein
MTYASNINAELNSKSYAFLPKFLSGLPTLEAAQRVGVPIQNVIIGEIINSFQKQKKKVNQIFIEANFWS